MDPISSRILLGAAGAGGAEPVYVEDVFSTYLYDGNGSSQTITNGIDLAGEGGMTWIKSRSVASNNNIHDTERGATGRLITDTTGAEITLSAGVGVTSFNSDGFSLGIGSSYNGSGTTYASWTFRKAPGFFDVVTYTGNSSSSHTISHALGSSPGVIIIKQASSTGNNWCVYHRSLGTSKKLSLNTTDAAETRTDRVTAVSSTTFTLGNSSEVNFSGSTYVAYIFAHDAAIFGESGSESVIKCGSYTGNGALVDVNLGWEAQWVLIKRTDSTSDWRLVDSMRGLTVYDQNSKSLQPNNSYSEAQSNTYPGISPTGFVVGNPAFESEFAVNGATYIYIAIRRGPMKTPTDATEVFDVINRYGTSSIVEIEPAITADWAITLRREGNAMYTLDRLRGDKDFYMEASNAESTSANEAKLVGNSTNSAYKLYNDTDVNNSFYQYINWFFKRAPGFFDMVAYAGTGFTSSHSHNLNAVPELIIVKNRSQSSTWRVYNQTIGNTKALALNLNNAAITTTLFGNTSPTSTVFTVGGFNDTNQSGSNYVAYLFASLDGVSKVGSYTGTGSNINVDCGFSAGARFVLIKRTDSTGDWYIWDTERGITAGNDPYIRIGAAPETTTTDYIDPYSAGFTVTSSAPADLNASGGSYIFLAIA